MSMARFGDRVIERMRTLGHPLCVGLDPYLDRIPPPFRRGAMTPGQPDTARAVEEFCCRTIDLVATDVAIVKPQVALFERLGWHGWQALERVVHHARTAGLLVLLDAKRGDIAETATAYARAYLAPDAPCSVDAMTCAAHSRERRASSARQCPRVGPGSHGTHRAIPGYGEAGMGRWLPASRYRHVRAPDFEWYDERWDPGTGEGGIDLYVPVADG